MVDTHEAQVLRYIGEIFPGRMLASNVADVLRTLVILSLLVVPLESRAGSRNSRGDSVFVRVETEGAAPVSSQETYEARDDEHRVVTNEEPEEQFFTVTRSTRESKEGVAKTFECFCGDDAPVESLTLASQSGTSEAALSDAIAQSEPVSQEGDTLQGNTVVSEAPKSQEAQETQVTPETPKSQEAQETPETPEIQEAQEAQEAQESSESSESLEYSEYSESSESSQKPFVALRTNLLYDAVLIPNIGVEVWLGKGFTLGADWFGSWLYSDKKHFYWQGYGGYLTARYYFGKVAAEQRFAGHHVGIYGTALTYDVEFGGIGYQAAKFGFGGGVEYGYSLKVAQSLSIDFNLGLGYQGGEYKKYMPTDDGTGHYVWMSTHRRHWWGPTKAEVSLKWFIGGGTKTKTKTKTEIVEKGGER